MANRKSTKGQTTIYKHTHKTKDRVTRTPLKTRGELRCSGRVGSSCSTIDTRRVNLVTNLLISHEIGNRYSMNRTNLPYFIFLVLDRDNLYVLHVPCFTKLRYWYWTKLRLLLTWKRTALFSRRLKHSFQTVL